MIWLELIVVAAILGSGLTVSVLSRHHGWRWGSVRGSPVSAGDGPYRGGQTTPTHLRGVPAVVRWAAGTGVAWGILTLLVFMPAGFLLLLVIGDATDTHGAWAAFAATMLLLVACDALILGFALLAIAPALVRGGEEGVRSARGVARWSTLHHLVVLLTFFTFALVNGNGFVLLVMSLVPCLLGLSQAGLLDRAADECESLATTVHLQASHQA